MVKERDQAGLKKNSTEVHKFIEELVKIGKVFIDFSSILFVLKLITTWIFCLFLKKNILIQVSIYISDFPGSKAVSEASSKFGPALVSGPVFFVFEKVSTFIVTEEKVEKAPATTETKTEDETSGVKEREIVVEEEKKEETSEKIESVAEKVEEKDAAEPTPPPAEKQEEKPVEPAAVEQVEPPKA